MCERPLCFRFRVTVLSKSEGHKEQAGRGSQTGLGTTMQKIEKSKENLNALLANYRPLGPRHLLAAALMLQAKKDSDASTAAPRKTVAAA